jgi:hypothetical protein
MSAHELRDCGQLADEPLVKYRRTVPLVVIGVSLRADAEPLATRLREEGAIALVAQGERACLRVATALGPDQVLLDPRLSRPLLSLLRAHPLSRRAQICWSSALASS